MKNQLKKQVDHWWKDAVVYQIYPRSFADSNADGIGDLEGIIGRLGYLSELGVDAIWLSPIFASPMADFGYDISDHCDIDAIFGTLADAESLIAASHDIGIRVIFDIVLGHTSNQHPWFLASSSHRDDRMRDFYVWVDGPTVGSSAGGPPNNWLAGFPEGAAAWSWHQPTQQWYLHSHLPEQPDLNWDNPAVVDAQLDVLRFWFERGIDGVRLDSINRLGKDPLLRDNVEGHPLRQQNWPSIHDHLRKVRRVIDKYQDRVSVGEVWLFDQRELVPYLAADQLHLAHNFAFARLPFDAARFKETIKEFAALAGDEIWPAWFLNNHDEPRVASRFDRSSITEQIDDRGSERARLLAVLLLTLRGTPFLYQGEELGLPDSPIPQNVVIDRNGRDPQRTPMPWLPPREAGPYAGFSVAEPWLPVGPAAEHMNVSDELASEESMLNFYRSMLRLRKSRTPLVRGDQTLIEMEDPRLLCYTRKADGETLLIILNFSVDTVMIGPGKIPESLRGHKWEILLSTHSSHNRKAASSLELRPLETVVIGRLLAQ
ncbi:MAG: alpha-amylase family glycosyl hydrolase [Rhodoglobus sp.]